MDGRYLFCPAAACFEKQGGRKRLASVDYSTEINAWITRLLSFVDFERMTRMRVYDFMFLASILLSSGAARSP